MVVLSLANVSVVFHVVAVIVVLFIVARVWAQEKTADAKSF